MKELVVWFIRGKIKITMIKSPITIRSQEQYLNEASKLSKQTILILFVKHVL